MAANLTDQVRDIADVTKAIARGDLSRKVRVEGRGEILELKETVNSLVDQLRTFASEVCSCEPFSFFSDGMLMFLNHARSPVSRVKSERRVNWVGKL